MPMNRAITDAPIKWTGSKDSSHLAMAAMSRAVTNPGMIFFMLFAIVFILIFKYVTLFHIITTPVWVPLPISYIDYNIVYTICQTFFAKSYI